MTQLENNSFSIGFIEGMFTIQRAIHQNEAQRYLDLCDVLDYSGQEGILKFILLNWPYLLEERE